MTNITKGMQVTAPHLNYEIASALAPMADAAFRALILKDVTRTEDPSLIDWYLIHTAIGEQLDQIGAMYGLKRTHSFWRGALSPAKAPIVDINTGKVVA